MAGGAGAPLVGGSICLALAATTAIGGVVCSAALVGVGAWGGAELGSMGGEYVGEKIFEAKQP